MLSLGKPTFRSTCEVHLYKGYLHDERSVLLQLFITQLIIFFCNFLSVFTLKGVTPTILQFQLEKLYRKINNE